MVLYLFEAEELIDVSVRPLVLAIRAFALVGPESVHDGLEDGGERCHSDPSRDQHSVLGAEDVAGRSSVRAVDEDLTT